MTALHMAVAVENAEYVKTFMDQGSELVVGSLDIWGREAIHIAAKLGNIDIVLQLTRLGGSVNRVDSFGKSATFYLFQQRRKLISRASLAEFIRASHHDTHILSDAKNPFHIAAEVASLEIIQELEKSVEDQWNEKMKSQDINGRTPLTLAILAGRPEVAPQLLQNLV